MISDESSPWILFALLFISSGPALSSFLGFFVSAEEEKDREDERREEDDDFLLPLTFLPNCSSSSSSWFKIEETRFYPHLSPTFTC